MSLNFDAYTTGDEVVAAFPQNVKGKIFLVTGPSPNGIGASTLAALASGQPEALILAGRDPASFATVTEQIKATDSTIRVVSVALDLASLASVRAAVDEVIANADLPRIDVLINNAGVMATPFGQTVDGIETQFATNHVGHFLLTALLLPKLLKATAPGPRVVNVSSSGHRLGSVESFADYNFTKSPYEPWKAYGQSKLANVLFTKELARRFGTRGLTAYSLHPGGVRTQLVRHVDPTVLIAVVEAAKAAPLPNAESFIMKTAEQGCSTTLVAALTPAGSDFPNGAYLSDCRLWEPLEVSHDLKAAEDLWALSEKLVHTHF